VAHGFPDRRDVCGRSVPAAMAVNSLDWRAMSTARFRLVGMDFSSPWAHESQPESFPSKVTSAFVGLVAGRSSKLGNIEFWKTVDPGNSQLGMLEARAPSLARSLGRI